MSLTAEAWQCLGKLSDVELFDEYTHHHGKVSIKVKFNGENSQDSQVRQDEENPKYQCRWIVSHDFNGQSQTNHWEHFVGIGSDIRVTELVNLKVLNMYTV